MFSAHLFFVFEMFQSTLAIRRKCTTPVPFLLPSGSHVRPRPISNRLIECRLCQMGMQVWCLVLQVCIRQVLVASLCIPHRRGCSTGWQQPTQVAFPCKLKLLDDGETWRRIFVVGSKLTLSPWYTQDCYSAWTVRSHLTKLQSS